jgi:hypothetical protein
MISAKAGEAKPPRTKQETMPKTVKKPTITLFGCIIVLLYVGLRVPLSFL